MLAGHKGVRQLVRNHLSVLIRFLEISNWEVLLNLLLSPDNIDVLHFSQLRGQPVDDLVFFVEYFLETCIKFIFFEQVAHVMFPLRDLEDSFL